MSPRTHEQQATIRERSRRNLLTSALELFARKGYHETTMSELAQSAGVSKGLIYHYYPGKKELLSALIEEGFSSFPEPADLLNQGDSRTVLALLLDGFLSLTQDSVRFWRLYFSLMMQPVVFEQAAGQFQSNFREMRNLLTELFRELDYEQPDQEALFFAGAVEGILFHYMIYEREYPLAVMRDFIASRYNLPNGAEGRTE